MRVSRISCTTHDVLISLLQDQPRQEMSITLPDGSQRKGTSWETSPMDIAKQISQGLADRTVIAKVSYTIYVSVSVFLGYGRTEIDHGTARVLELARNSVQAHVHSWIYNFAECGPRSTLSIHSELIVLMR